MSDEPKKPDTGMEVMPPPSQGYVEKAEARSLEFMNPKRWQAMNVMAQTFMMSGALPTTIKNAPQLVMVMQAGYEAGLQPLESMNAFYFVNGKLSMYGDVAISQVRKAGHKIEWGTCNATTATVTITRGDTGESLSTTFTMDMARQRGLTKNDVYQKYPENMLKFKAFHATAKFICPDALHGVPVKEDIEGEVVDVTPPADETKGKGKKKGEAKDTGAETTPPPATGHAPLADTLNQPDKPADEADEKDEDEAKGDSPARKAMKRGLKKTKEAGDSYVPAGTTFALTGDKEKDEKLYNAIIEDELNGMKLGAEQKKFIEEYRKAYQQGA